MASSYHIPGRPRCPKPADIVDIATSLHHPDIVRCGITTTVDGEWAILVVVRKGTAVPIKEIEDEVAVYPVIYDEDTNGVPLARPAYPDLGE